MEINKHYKITIEEVAPTADEIIAFYNPKNNGPPPVVMHAKQKIIYQQTFSEEIDIKKIVTQINS